ncbi:MAG: 4'-phosphopantetheinyl transferase superfamily protein, partial [Chloroflexi bacterium]|nr:4'-phosphopantetheinyl transferase superfamily protein [Chloroflexota bacterium]
MFARIQDKIRGQLPVGPEVHLWFARLDDAQPLAADFDLLAADERQRAERFRLDLHRQRFVAGRVILRRLVSFYTGQAPQEIRFSYGPQGKPTLTPPGLHFNLAHSGEHALYAFSLDRPLGVDLESPQELDAVQPLIQRYLTAPDRALFRLDASGLDSASPQELLSRFYRCWTFKEAWLKAQGIGLYGLDKVYTTRILYAPIGVIFEVQAGVRRWQALVDQRQGLTYALVAAGTL